MEENVAAGAAPESGPKVLTPAECTEYDFYLVLDKSGSMGGASARFPGSTLWQEAKEFTQGLAAFAAQADDDGLTLIVFGSDVKSYDGVKPDKVDEIFNNEHPSGRTNLLGALEAVMDKYRTAGKKAIVTVVTDGAPNPGTEEQIAKLIVDAANGINADEDLTFGFVQMGRDVGAAKFLDFLDDDLQARGAKFDIVDAAKAEVAEALSIPQLLAKFQAD